MLNVDNLHVAYSGNKEVLNGVSLRIERGTIAAVIGPSGGGKSTLLRAIAGLIPAADSVTDFSPLPNWLPPQSARITAGKILIDGSPPDLKSHQLGYMAQDYGLLPHLTARQNITLGVKIQKRRDWQAEFARLTERLALTAVLDNYISALSGGQKQRVSLARYFLLAPPLLLIDEPFSALDAITRETAWSTFLSLWREAKITTLFVTHQLEEAMLLGEKIITLNGELKFMADNPFFGIADDAPGKKDFAEKLHNMLRSIQK